MSTRSERSMVEAVVKVFPVIAAIACGIWTVFVYFHPATSATVGGSATSPSAVAQPTATRPDIRNEPAPQTPPPIDSSPTTASTAETSTTQGSAPPLEGAASAVEAVRSFYGYLHDGRGKEASLLVIPEKRLSGPFAAFELSNFYGNLRQPIELLDVTAIDESSYRVHYRYAATKSICEDWASIKTKSIGRRYFVSIIKTSRGC